MTAPKITKSDVQAAAKAAPRRRKISKVPRQVFVEVEEGMNWADLTHNQRRQVLFQHENRWRKRVAMEGAAKQAEHKLSRG